MATKIDKLIEKLDLREGKVLRYIVSTEDQPVGFSRVVNHIEWSDLPHSALEAKASFDTLLKMGLIKRSYRTQGAYTFTDLGQKVIARATEKKLWQNAPAPSVTGISTFKPSKKPARRKSTKKSTRRK